MFVAEKDASLFLSLTIIKIFVYQHLHCQQKQDLIQTHALQVFFHEKKMSSMQDICVSPVDKSSFMLEGDSFW